MRKDLEKMSFEELINLQKSLNETITKKRKGDVGDLIRELKNLHQKRAVLDKKIDDLERIISYDKLYEILKKNHNSHCYFTNKFHLLVYYNQDNQDQKMTIDIESMQIVTSKGYSDDEISSILDIVNDVVNGENGAKNEE